MGGARGRRCACAWDRGGGEEAAAVAVAAAPSACFRCIFRVGGVMVTGEGAAEVRGGVGGVADRSWPVGD